MPNEEQAPKQWKHKVRIGSYIDWSSESTQFEEDSEIKGQQEKIKQSLATLLQAKHLNLLIGNGLTTAIAKCTGATSVNMLASEIMPKDEPELTYSRAVEKAAEKNAQQNGPRKPNIEHTIRAMLELIQGLKVISMNPESENGIVQNVEGLKQEWLYRLNNLLTNFLRIVLKTEAEIRLGVAPGAEAETSSEIKENTKKTSKGLRLLGSFLLTFASRTATRGRLHVFTTNYDRLIEFGADFLGLRIIDRFVGKLEPVFRTSRLEIDMHYNPPGIREEPRYLEGVIRMTKLHGSIDWKKVDSTGQRNEIIRVALPFGAEQEHLEAFNDEARRLLIYPNPVKDIETTEYPYAELFRDFATAVCQPNAVIVTYGYGFGDDHINRTLQDMLTISSTHIVIISFDDPNGRISEFYNEANRHEQISLLIGSHFGDLETLVKYYLPTPAIELVNWNSSEFISTHKMNDQTQNTA